MAHFAKVDENNVVQEVIVISNDDLNNLPFPESEPVGQKFIADFPKEGRWLQTSYNNNFRNKYCGIGHLYIEEHDAFVDPKPYPSWSLNESLVWQAPVPVPSLDGSWSWNETLQEWQR